MADVKTKLRELSVGAAIGVIQDSSHSYELVDLQSSDTFFDCVSTYIKNIDKGVVDSLRNVRFSAELLDIIRNGIQLAQKITADRFFQLPLNPKIYWLGNNTQKDDPVDLRVDKYGFSLKEDSFILENMGLYKLLNCYTGSQYEKRHIFEDYAQEEYNEWFTITWKEMYHFLTTASEWDYNDYGKQKTSIIRLEDNAKIIFIYQEGGELPLTVSLPIDCSLDIFKSSTNSKLREQVFSRFINDCLKNNNNYNNAKKHCSEVAAENLARELNEKLDYSAGIARFLRVHDEEYYYAKTTKNGVEIFRVPALADFTNEISIESIVASVPDTQANILTTIKNNITGKKLILRNECRFSHGQFNGTPEAKMYYERGGSLETIYQSI